MLAFGSTAADDAPDDDLAGDGMLDVAGDDAEGDAEATVPGVVAEEAPGVDRPRTFRMIKTIAKITTIATTPAAASQAGRVNGFWSWLLLVSGEDIGALSLLSGE